MWSSYREIYTSSHGGSRGLYIIHVYIGLKWVQTLEVLEISVEVTRDLFRRLRWNLVGHEDTFRLVRAGCSRKIESVSGRGHRHERLDTRYRSLHEYIGVMSSDCRRQRNYFSGKHEKPAMSCLRADLIISTRTPSRLCAIPFRSGLSRHMF